MSEQEFKNPPSAQVGAQASAGDDLSSWLEAALHATSGGSESNDPSTAILMKNLLDIRKSHLDEGIDFTSVSQKMVQAVFDVRYGAKSYGTMAKAVVDSLENDPVCRQRLESLWDRLGRAVGEQS